MGTVLMVAFLAAVLVARFWVIPAMESGELRPKTDYPLGD